MKYTNLIFVLILTFILSTSCSGVKVINTWTSDNVKTVKSKNILVIARTSHKPSRIAFEDAIAKELTKKGLKASVAYKKFPEIDPDRKLTPEEITSIKEMFKNEGINAIVVSVLKDVKEISQTQIEGGYTAGESLGSYYNIPSFGFYGYYGHPGSLSNYKGVDVATTITTRTAKIYILQTAVHNLDLTEKEQLVSLITSEIEQPENIPDYADGYAKTIMKSIKNN